MIFGTGSRFRKPGPCSGQTKIVICFCNFVVIVLWPHKITNQSHFYGHYKIYLSIYFISSLICNDYSTSCVSRLIDRKNYLLNDLERNNEFHKSSYQIAVFPCSPKSAVLDCVLFSRVP